MSSFPPRSDAQPVDGTEAGRNQQEDHAIRDG